MNIVDQILATRRLDGQAITLMPPTMSGADIDRTPFLGGLAGWRLPSTLNSRNADCVVLTTMV